MTFLPNLDPRALTITSPDGIRPEGLLVGTGGQALEVAVLAATRRVTGPELRTLPTQRTGRRATPVIVVALMSGGRAAIAATLPGDVSVIPD